MASSLLISTMVVFMAIFTQCEPQKYIFVSQIKTINAAEIYCRDTYGTKLASIHSAEDNDEAYRLCLSPKCADGSKCHDACSIGAKVKRDGVCIWSDKSLFNYWNWYSFDSDIQNNGCAVLWSNNHPSSNHRGRWGNCPCDGIDGFKQRFLCNSPPSTDISTAKPTMMPTNIPTINPTVLPSLIPSTNPSYVPTNNPTLNPNKNTNKLHVILKINEIEVEDEFESTVQNQDMTSYTADNASDSSASIDMTTVYMVGGICGALVFTLLCICTLFVLCFVSFWKHKRKQKADVNEANDDDINIKESKGDKASERHCYHRSVLSECVFNTIHIDDDEGGEQYVSDTDVEDMYEQSADSTPTHTQSDCQSDDDMMAEIKIDHCVNNSNLGVLDTGSDTDGESDSVSLGDMYQQPIYRKSSSKKK
eukprot:1167865_1